MFRSLSIKVVMMAVLGSMIPQTAYSEEQYELVEEDFLRELDCAVNIGPSELAPDNDDERGWRIVEHNLNYIQCSGVKIVIVDPRIMGDSLEGEYRLFNAEQLGNIMARFLLKGSGVNTREFVEFSMTKAQKAKLRRIVQNN